MHMIGLIDLIGFNIVQKIESRWWMNLRPHAYLYYARITHSLTTFLSSVLISLEKNVLILMNPCTYLLIERRKNSI